MKRVLAVLAHCIIHGVNGYDFTTEHGYTALT